MSRRTGAPASASSSALPAGAPPGGAVRRAEPPHLGRSAARAAAASPARAPRRRACGSAKRNQDERRPELHAQLRARVGDAARRGGPLKRHLLDAARRRQRLLDGAHLAAEADRAAEREPRELLRLPAVVGRDLVGRVVDRHEVRLRRAVEEHVLDVRRAPARRGVEVGDDRARPRRSGSAPPSRRPPGPSRPSALDAAVDLAADVAVDVEVAAGLARRERVGARRDGLGLERRRRPGRRHLPRDDAAHVVVDAGVLDAITPPNSGRSTMCAVVGDAADRDRLGGAARARPSAPRASDAAGGAVEHDLAGLAPALQRAADRRPPATRVPAGASRRDPRRRSPPARGCARRRPPPARASCPGSSARGSSRGRRRPAPCPARRTATCRCRARSRGPSG